MIKKLLIVLFIFIFASVGGASWEAINFLNSSQGGDRREIIFEVPNGASFYALAQKLEKQNIVSSAFKLRILAKFTRQAHRIKVGEYRLYSDMTPREILRVLVSGQSISYKLTIPEGFNIFEVRDQLNLLWPGRGDELFHLINNPKFISNLTGEKMISMEGYLFPDTYSITKYTSVESLVRKMYEYFLKNIKEINQNATVSMSVKDQVILASVIEKETGAPEERPIISSVFHNRLNKKMRLQSDPTILYGILMESKEMKKNITKEDIHRFTPYNTYKVPALPVAPIANPGRDALWAAVHPADTDYLYFVSQNNGTHIFSKNYDQHDAAVKKYQLNRKMREGSSWRDLKKHR